TATAKDRFERGIALEGDLDDDQRARLIEMADRCPVHRTITEGAEVVTRAVDEAPSPADDHGDHFQCMDAACAEAGTVSDHPRPFRPCRRTLARRRAGPLERHHLAADAQVHARAILL